ncbi:MAG: PilT/PilU family type 4a pilus ATPase [Lentisphaerae bacterium]|nr:PilT/PilU family type 4a pilus ATPase [Lentisphaerota bacterium]
MKPGETSRHPEQPTAHALRLRDLVEIMCDRRASDLILTPGIEPQLRINGLLTPMEGRRLTPEDTEALVSEILNEKETHFLQTHRSIDFSRSITGLARVRTNVFYQRNTLALALRLIPAQIPSMEELGLPSIVRDFASESHGLFLVTGPVGTGKTTTLAAMIDHIKAERHVHIVCIEDPIEFVHQHGRGIIDQREVGQDTHSFRDALRVVFRQSPDIIMVGEMRDLESIELALSLAETGHLILATLHTPDTAGSIARIAGAFPKHIQEQVYTQLSSVLVGVLSQVLIPAADGSRRVLGCEVLKATPAVKNLIREQELHQIYSVIQTGRDEGMITMNESLLRLCRKGAITQQAALQHSPRRTEMATMIQNAKLKA